MSASRIAGIAFICLGTVFIAGGGSKPHGEADAVAIAQSDNQISEVAR